MASPSTREGDAEESTAAHADVNNAAASQAEASTSNYVERQKHGLDSLGSRLSNLQQNILHRQESLSGSVSLERY